MTELNLTDAQVAGQACCACGKTGTEKDGQHVGTTETVEGTRRLWACYPACVGFVSVLAGRFP